MEYYIELVWNREFNWCRWGHGHATPEAAASAARSLMNAGDGASVKKARVVDDEGNVVIERVSC